MAWISHSLYSILLVFWGIDVEVFLLLRAKEQFKIILTVEIKNLVLVDGIYNEKSATRLECWTIKPYLNYIKNLTSYALMGKLPMGILGQAGGVPVYLMAGKIDDREKLLQAGFARVDCINPPGISLSEALQKEVAQRNIRNTICGILRERY